MRRAPLVAARAYVPVAPKNHEGDVEASPVHLEEQLGGLG